MSDDVSVLSSEMQSPDPRLLLVGQVVHRRIEFLDQCKLRWVARAEVCIGSTCAQRAVEPISIVRLTLGQQFDHRSVLLYRANRNHPTFAELHALLAKTAGVSHQLAEALNPLAKSIEFAFVYGSFARGDENAGSDIDLMVIGQVTLDELLEHLSPLERTLRRPINPTIYSQKELRAKLKAGNHFLKAIQKGKNTFLIGDENEF
jgi:uncharacterized protein